MKRLDEHWPTGAGGACRGGTGAVAQEIYAPNLSPTGPGRSRRPAFR